MFVYILSQDMLKEIEKVFNMIFLAIAFDVRFKFHNSVLI